MPLASRSSRILVAAGVAAALATAGDAGAQASSRPPVGSAGPVGPATSQANGPLAGPANGSVAGPANGKEFPLANIELTIRGPGTRPIPPLRTNARGEFSVQLEKGDYRVTASGRQVAGVVKSMDCCPGDFDADGKDDLNVGIALKHADQSTDRGRAGGVSYHKITFQDILISSIRIPEGGGTFAGRLWAVGPRK